MGLDDVGAELPPDAADQDLDGIRLSLVEFPLQLLRQFVLRHYPALMMHEVGDKPVLLRRERQWNSFSGYSHQARVQCDVAQADDRAGKATSAAQDGAQS